MFSSYLSISFLLPFNTLTNNILYRLSCRTNCNSLPIAKINNQIISTKNGRSSTSFAAANIFSVPTISLIRVCAGLSFSFFVSLPPYRVSISTIAINSSLLVSTKPSGRLKSSAVMLSMAFTLLSIICISLSSTRVFIAVIRPGKCLLLD